MKWYTEELSLRLLHSRAEEAPLVKIRAVNHDFFFFSFDLGATYIMPSGTGACSPVSALGGFPMVWQAPQTPCALGVQHFTANIGAGEGSKWHLAKNTGFRLKPIACCSTTLLTVMEPGCFTPVKKLGAKEESSLRSRGGGGNPVVPITQLGLEHSALPSLTGNQKTPGSVLSAQPCLQLLEGSSSHKSPAVF